MAVEATIAFATSFLEDDHFLSLYEWLYYFAFHFGTLYGGHPDLYVAVGVEKQHFIESYLLSGFYFIAEMVHIQILAFLGFELLALDVYNCVHCN